MRAFWSKSHKFFLLVTLFMVFCTGWSFIPNRFQLLSLQEEKAAIKEDGAKDGMGMKLYPTGSTLPDCSHACGSCFPCKTVIVSYKCLIAESCPVVYRCMCKGKYYHVPSN